LGDIPVHWHSTYIKGITKTFLLSEKGKPELDDYLSVYRDYGVIKLQVQGMTTIINLEWIYQAHKSCLPKFLGIETFNKINWSGFPLVYLKLSLGIVSPAYITCKIDLRKS
jgi:hypothetical protein